MVFGRGGLVSRIVLSQVPFLLRTQLSTYLQYIHFIEYVQGIKEYPQSYNDKIAAKKACSKVQPLNCKVSSFILKDYGNS